MRIFITRNILLFLFVFVFCQSNAQEELKTIKIGTGNITGIYYPLGAAICRLYNHNISSINESKCLAIPSSGSLENLVNLKNGDIEFGILQSDIQKHAYYNKEYDNKNLRSLFSFYQEKLTLVTRKDSNIKVLEDIKGKKINVDTQGSGSRRMINEIFKIYNFGYDDFQKVTQYNLYQPSDQLCNGTIDAAFFLVGHPNAAIQDIIRNCKIKIIPINGKKINDFLSTNNDYFKSVIHKNTYPGIHQDVETIAVNANLVTNANLDTKIVYNIVKNVFENVEAFKKLHPAFADFNIQSMVMEGNQIPFHEGALQYYREKGFSLFQSH